ncbi:MAG: hypothetical protein E7Z91_00985 [Cyanobacteria bacterium SIG30]|nr:hypothetical protein [Cyanobacteria bacterium SIG30]
MAVAERESLFNKENNFFTNSIIANEYEKAKEAFQEASKPAKKKVYRNMTKMLEESYFIGSLKYGNNFVF